VLSEQHGRLRASCGLASCVSLGSPSYRLSTMMVASLPLECRLRTCHLQRAKARREGRSSPPCFCRSSARALRAGCVVLACARPTEDTLNDASSHVPGTPLLSGASLVVLARMHLPSLVLPVRAAWLAWLGPDAPPRHHASPGGLPDASSGIVPTRLNLFCDRSCTSTRQAG